MSDLGALAMDPATVWIAIVAAAAGTIFWRLLGIVLAGHIDVEGPVYRWVSSVAYAMVAGLIARVLIMPGGETDPVQMGMRAGALGIGLLVWWLMGWSVLGGLAAGVGAFAFGVYMMG